MSRAPWSLLPALGLALLASCTGDPFDPASLPNERPVARLWVSGDSLSSVSYNERTFHWSATDIDGEVVGFHVAIGEGATPPTRWVFTTQDESTATYSTDLAGRALPTVHVVAQDDRGALSDTVRATYPLVNFPPVLEFANDFTPLKESFGAASFQFFGFDLDGDETLLPWVEYRYAGSDSNLVFDIGDTLADPSLGWVRLAKAPTRFSLALQDIPPGDPADGWRQTLYVRTEDEAGARAQLVWTWPVFEVRGQVLLVDDNPTAASRDQFWADALDAALGGEYSRWDIADGLPERDQDLMLTLGQFRLLVWYTGNGASQNLQRAQLVLRDYMLADVNPDQPGTQGGRLLLMNTAVVGQGSNLNPAFRSQVVGVEGNPDPRNTLATYNGQLQAAIGNLEVNSQDPAVPDLESEGLNYQGGPGRYFGLSGLKPAPGTAPLYRFEPYTWGGPSDPTCRLGCEPVVATRRPNSGVARAVLLGFQLEYANALGNALSTVADLLTMMGVDLATGEVQ